MEPLSDTATLCAMGANRAAMVAGLLAHNAIAFNFRPRRFGEYAFTVAEEMRVHLDEFITKSNSEIPDCRKG